ncbi:MAG: peptide chain release factor 2 [Desulfobaccales bacterium]
MLEFYGEYKAKLSEYQNRLTALRSFLELDKKQGRLAEIDKVMGAAEFWEDPQAAAEVQRERSGIINSLEGYERQAVQVEDLEVLLELAREEEDVQAMQEVAAGLAKLDREFKEWQLQLLMGSEDDQRNAIITIHAGAGGTEANDWCEMLLRMYLRYAEIKGFKTETIDLQEGDEAGVKSATFSASGPYAYGNLKSEHGIHRLVRISPFDASGRRHTSFAAVQVLPEVDDRISIEILDKDLRVDTFRASGPGGQHVNKTSSAVRLTHLPTNIVVISQSERSQHRNRELAMKVLRARLYDLERRKRQEKKQELQETQKDIAWGSQIRSYVLQPYQLVKDHRTKHEEGDVDRVLNGDIQGFVEAYLLNPEGEN